MIRVVTAPRTFYDGSAGQRRGWHGGTTIAIVYDEALVTNLRDAGLIVVDERTPVTDPRTPHR